MEMIFDDLRQGSMAPEASCRRQNAFSEFNSAGVVLDGGDAKKSKYLRRKKMELRRIKSVSVAKSGDLVFFPDRNGATKKTRSDFKEGFELMKEALLAQLPRNDVVGGSRGAKCPAHGEASIIGRRREMEDAVATELGFLKKGGRSYNFYGVYDGHGGGQVARACREMLHKLLVEIVGEGAGEEIAWERVMVAGFRKMDKEVNKSGAAVASTGSTAVVAVVGEEEVVVANCGDSRAVLCRGGVAVQISDDHKPDRPDELERIEGCGGKVINWNGQRVLGVLATSRAIGDQYLKPFVISDPEVKIMSRTESDEFFILASDGLWDVISNDLACQVVRRCLDGRMRKSSSDGARVGGGRAAEAAAVLAELAMARGSYDNISVIVVDLRNSSPVSQLA